MGGATSGVGSTDVLGVARRRKMCRSYLTEPVRSELVETAIEVAHRAPTAGNTDARRFLVLDTPELVEQYWSVTLSAHRRANFAWPGLLVAPVLVLIWTQPDAYLERYSEPDKSSTGLGADPASWPVPYWWVDGGMAAEGLLLSACDQGLGACFFGLFDHEAAVAAHFGVPDGWRSVGAISLGWPETSTDRPSGSAGRGRPDPLDAIYRGRWGSA